MKKKTERINFYADCKLNLACSDDENRPLFQSIMFFDNRAWATDARIMMRADVSKISTLPQESIEKLNGKCIHKDVYKKLLSYDVIIPMDNKIEARKYKNDVVDYFEYTPDYERRQDVIDKNIKPVMENFFAYEDVSVHNYIFSISEMSKIISVFPNMDKIKHIHKKNDVVNNSILIPYKSDPYDNKDNVCDYHTAPIVFIMVGYLDCD